MEYSEGEYSQRENFFSGGWTSKSGGTSYELVIQRELIMKLERCLSIACHHQKMGKCFFFDDMTNSWTL